MTLALDRATENAVGKLHKGLGVRRDDLSELLFSGSRLGGLWGIGGTDAGIVMLAKAIYRLEQVIRYLPPALRPVAPVIYNLRPDSQMHDLELGEREELFRRRHPNEEYSSQTMTRRKRLLRAAVEKSLESRLPPIPDDDLLIIVRREVEFADRLNGWIGPVAFARKVSRIYAAQIGDAADAFLRLRVLVPSSRSNEMIVARTRNHGDWLCVFSTEEALRAHQRATAQPWSGSWTTMPGGDVVNAVLGRWNSVGVLVNPPAHRSADASAALRLTPAMLFALVSGR